ncbi:MAG TPA: hypothetical protein VGT41_01135 [Candidatus Babeliales bacterium]|nr:hypothetical protein [Candidatus Babeliales bacterium]
MNFVKLVYNGKYYSYVDVSNMEMHNLGIFLSTDVGYDIELYKNWASNDTYPSVSGNITVVDKENEKVCVCEMYSDEDVPTELLIGIPQFLQLLDDWNEKVCKLRPQEVVIKHENDQFIIETKNETSIS